MELKQIVFWFPKNLMIKFLIADKTKKFTLIKLSRFTCNTYYFFPLYNQHDRMKYKKCSIQIFSMTFNEHNDQFTKCKD